MTFVKILKELRRKNHMTQEKLSDLLGVGRSTVSMWEIDASEPDGEMVRSIAEIFNITTDYLLGRTDDPSPLSANRADQEDDDITFDDFTYAMSDESGELTEAEKEMLLDMARKLVRLRKEQEKNGSAGSPV